MKYTISINQGKAGWDYSSSVVDGKASTKVKHNHDDLKKAFEEAVKVINQWQESSDSKSSTPPQKQAVTAAKA